MSATKSNPSMNNLPFKGASTPAFEKDGSVQTKFGVNAALEAAITGKTVATPGLFGNKPNFFAGNTPSSFKASALQINPRPLTNKSTKNRGLVMMSNTVVD